MAEFDYLTLEEAQTRLLSRVEPLVDFDTLPLLDAVGRVGFEDMRAVMDQPPFNRSPLDGYAVNHLDIAEAGPANPALLRVAQTIYAGDSFDRPLARGQAARVTTGAPVPPGADCVVRQEDTDSGTVEVNVFVSLDTDDNICFRGEDARCGVVLVRRGERLDSGRVGMLACQGMTEVRVFRRPRVGILSTGSELASAGSPLAPGKIYDSNRSMLAARAKELAAAPILGPNTPDDPEALAQSIGDLLERCDLVVTTGGVSVGERDYLPRVGEMLGAERLFHGVALKPGSPALALRKDGKCILALSGNPFAAFATFELLVVPLLRRLADERETLPRRVKGVMAGVFPKRSSGRRMLRARIEGAEVSFPGEGHESGVISSLGGCNCLIDIPPGTPGLEMGMAVEAILL